MQLKFFYSFAIGVLGRLGGKVRESMAILGEGQRLGTSVWFSPLLAFWKFLDFWLQSLQMFFYQTCCKVTAVERVWLEAETKLCLPEARQSENQRIILAWQWQCMAISLATSPNRPNLPKIPQDNVSEGSEGISFVSFIHHTFPCFQHSKEAVLFLHRTKRLR